MEGVKCHAQDGRRFVEWKEGATDEDGWMEIGLVSVGGEEGC